MKSWSKERWRKLYLREALEQRSWSVVARGLRDYLIRVAEDDGALVRDSDDPMEQLLRALGAHPNEAELVRGAIGLLRRDGFLTGSARSVFVRNLPEAQEWEPKSAPRAPETPVKLPSSNPSNERVRQFRDRQRQAAAAQTLIASSVPTAAHDAPCPVTSVTGNVTSAVTGPVTSVTGNVTSAVTSPVTSSRGSRNLKSSGNFLDLQKDKQTDLLPPAARASGVTSTVPRPVTGVTSTVTSRVTGPSADDEDNDQLQFPRNPEDQPKGTLSERAAAIRDLPVLAAVAHPECWPEVIGVAQALARSSGLPEPRLGPYARDPGVRALVELYAAGFTQHELERVAAIVPKQAWWSAAGKRLGLSSLSIEVVRRNLPGIGPPREASPNVAKVLASVQRRREAG